MANTKEAEVKKEEVKELEAKKPLLLRANPTKLGLVGYMTNDRVLNVESGVTLDDIENPEFYTHISEKLKPFDTIRVRAEDMSFYAEVLVLRSTGVATEVAVLKYIDLSNAIKRQDLSRYSEYELRFMGLNGWCAIRKSDNVTVEQGHESEGSLLSALGNHIKAGKR